MLLPLLHLNLIVISGLKIIYNKIHPKTNSIYIRANLSGIVPLHFVHHASYNLHRPYRFNLTKNNPRNENRQRFQNG